MQCVLQNVEGEHAWYMQRGKMMSWIVVQDYVILVLCFTLINFCITWAEYMCLRLACFCNSVCLWFAYLSS